jgi:hypothetical protein
MTWEATVAFHNIDAKTPTTCTVEPDQFGFLKISVPSVIAAVLKKADRIACSVKGTGADTSTYRPYITLSWEDDEGKHEDDYGINSASVRKVIDEDRTSMLVVRTKK